MIPIVIPAYQPDERLLAFLETLTAHPDLGPILVVDDGSGSDYDALFESAQAVLARRCDDDIPSRLVRFAVNRGKGGALKEAFSFIRDTWPQACGCVTADWDGRHLPTDIAAVSRALAAHPQALVLGVRNLEGPNISRKTLVASRLSSTLFQMTTGQTLKDTLTGLRGIPADLFPELLTTASNRFDFEMETLFVAVNQDRAFMEVPIVTACGNWDCGNHYRPFVDTVLIGRIQLARFLRFSASSLFSTLIDLILFWLFCPLFEAHIDGIWYITWATIAARFLSALQNWLTNYYLVFHSSGNIFDSAGKYFLLTGVLILINAACMTVLVAILPAVPPVVLKLMVNFVLFIGSYNIQKRYVYS